MRGLIAVCIFAILTGSAFGAESAAPSAGVSAPAPQPKQDPIEIKDGLISAVVKDETLGSVMASIAYKTKINVHIHPALTGKKVTTNFTGLDLDQGMRRILALAGAANYRVLYDEKGQISALKVYKESSDKTNKATRINQPARGFPEPQAGAAQRRAPTRFSRRRPVTAAPNAPGIAPGIAPAPQDQSAGFPSGAGDELPPELLNGAEEELEMEEELPEEAYSNR